MKNVIAIQPFYLAQPLGATDVTMQVRGLKDSRGNLITAMPSGVTELTITIEPKSATNQEFVSGTGITDNGNGLVTITGLTRNLSPVDGSADLSDTVSHANNSECVVSNSPFSMRNVLTTDEDKTVTAIISFGASPTVPTGVNPTDVVNKSQLDATVAGTVPASSTTVLGAVRVASDPTKTLGTATMTIASPCVVTFNSHGLTANDTVRFTTTIALPTGIVAGTTYYVIATGLTANTFQLSLTLGGTAVVTTGTQSGVHTLYRTTPYAVNDQDTRLPTQGENDALAGTSGNPGSGNKYVTDADTTGTGAVLRASSVSTKFGGDGTDGALTISSGATNIDCAGAQLVVKNYSSISITGTGSLTFSNPHANGTTIVLKSQGAVTLTSSTTPMIDGRNMGASGGVAVTAAAQTAGNVGNDGVGTIISSKAGAGANPPSVGTGGAVPTLTLNALAYSSTRTKYITVIPGSGGGGGALEGGGGSATTGATGGRGGGAIIIECAGAWNFTTANGINVSGQSPVAGADNGTNQTASAGAGGGSGGCFIAQYNTLTANSGTVVVAGGVGGNNGPGSYASNRRGSGGGGYLVAGSSGTGPAGASAKSGGDGAVGYSSITKNVDLA